ncbi:MAG: DUF4012 domain-containing protein [Actinomycetota bacterium]
MNDRWWDRADHTGRVVIPSVIAAVAGLVAVLGDAEPTGTGWADVAWRFGAAVAVTLFAGRAAPWAWIVLGAGAAAMADGPWIAVGSLALALAVAGSFLDVPVDAAGALVGAVAVQALLHADVPGPLGTELVLALVVCAPVVASGATRIHPRSRTTLASAAALLVVAGITSSIAAGVVAVDARSDLTRSVELVELALDEARDGNELQAADHLAEARELWSSLASDLDAPWFLPARATPVAGQHLNAVLRLSESGADVAGAGASLLSELDAIDLGVSAGAIDLTGVESLQDPADAVVAEADALLAALDEVDTPWLVAPAADRLDEARVDLADGIETIRDANAFLTLAPELLGRDEPQEYLVLFGTTAENRGGGGFAGNFAELTADDGRIVVSGIGRGETINDGLPEGGADLDPALVEAYEPFSPQLFVQNIAVSPDFDVTGAAAAAMYEQSTGRAVDGVLMLDHTAMAALVDLTGPVQVDGRRIGARAIGDFVLVDNYVLYDDDEDARLQALDQLVLGVASQLTAIEAPSPWRLADTFGPVVRGRGLQFWSPRTDVADALATIGLSGRFPEPDGRDLLAVVTRNMGGNKIDAFLERTITYAPTVDPATGELQATAVIELTNSAPPTGLPDAIIGNNDQGFPFGTNVSEVTVFTPSVLTSARLDGDEVAMSTSEELGWLRHRYEVMIPPESTVRLELDLIGALDVREGYRLTVPVQALPRPDALTVDLDDERWARAEVHGAGETDGRTITVREDLSLEVGPAGGDTG